MTSTLVILILGGAAANDNAMACPVPWPDDGLAQMVCGDSKPEARLQIHETRGTRSKSRIERALDARRREIARCYFENERSSIPTKRARLRVFIGPRGHPKVTPRQLVFDLLVHCAKRELEGVRLPPGAPAIVSVDVEAQMAYCEHGPRRSRYRTPLGVFPERI